MSDETSIEQPIPDEHVCRNCGKPISISARYCRHCGAPQEGTSETVAAKYDQVWVVALFFVTQLLLCILFAWPENVEDTRDAILFDGLFIATTIIFASIGWKHIRPALSLRGFSIARAGFYILLAAGFSIMVQYTMDWLNHNLFETEVYYFEAFRELRYPLLWMILTLAVEPAIIEELGYRGFMQGTLNNILDKPQSMAVTAFAFAVIHLSLISIIWLMPFALLLGYVRMRENNLWYGVLMHLVFNSVAVLHDLPEYFASN